MGSMTEELKGTTKVKASNGQYVRADLLDLYESFNNTPLPDDGQPDVGAMSQNGLADFKTASPIADMFGGKSGIQTAQEMFNQTYAEGVAEDYLASIFETQLTPEQLEAQRLGLSVDQMKGDTEDIIKNILQFGGQDKSNQLAINALVAGKAKQAGVPQPSQQDIIDYLADIGLQQEAAAANDPQSLLDKGIDVAQKGIETVQGGINTVGRKVGEGIDKVFEILNLPNPTKGILAPGQKSGTLVWGQSGGNPVISAGTTGAGTQVGVTSGNVGLDAVLNRVTEVLTGKVAADELINEDIIREILVGQASEELGVSVDAVEDGIKGLNKVKDAVIPPTAYGVDLGKEPKIGSSEVEQLNVTGDMGGSLDTVTKAPEQLSVAGGVGGSLDTVTKGTRIPPATDKGKNKGVGAGEISDRVIGEGLKGTTPQVVIPDTFVPKGDLPKVVIPDTFVPKGDEPASKGNLPVEQSSGTFTGGIRTSPGELVDIDYLYDIGGESIFAPKLKSKEQEDPLAYLYSGYADGGIVQDSDVQQFIQYLMGTRG